jgi:cyclopropane-fatty-acyl-phospholipid synthase
MLPSKTVFAEVAAQQGLRVSGLHAFGPDYAETLLRWHQVFNQASGEVRALGFDERFMRTWRFYLAYCEAGFRAGATDVVQARLEHA